MQPMENTDTRTTLLRLCSEKGTSLAALSALIGRNSSYLQQFVRKGSPRKLEEGDRRRLARFFGVDESLLGGEITVPVKEKSSRLPASSARGGDWTDVPRLALDASAGPGALAAGQRRLGALRFRKAGCAAWGWIRRIFPPSRWRAIRCGRCSTMATKFWSITPAPPRAMASMWCAWAIICWSSASTWAARPRAPQSENPAYDPIDLDPEEVAVIGRVVWKGGRL
jgi:hypothetical protein